MFVHFGLEIFTLPGRNGYFIENRCFSVRQRRCFCNLYLLVDTVGCQDFG